MSVGAHDFELMCGRILMLHYCFVYIFLVQIMEIPICGSGVRVKNLSVRLPLLKSPMNSSCLSCETHLETSSQSFFFFLLLQSENTFVFITSGFKISRSPLSVILWFMLTLL